MKRFWATRLPVVLLFVGLILATCLLAQVNHNPGDNANVPLASTSLAGPANQETSEAARLIEALNAGDSRTVLEALGAHGFAGDKLASMAAELSKSPARAGLKEPFLKAAASVSLGGNPAELRARLQTAQSLGYGRLLWIARAQDTNWVARCDAELLKCGTAPIGVLNVKLNDLNFIRLFQWYDRYAERLHSVVLNGEALTNARMDDNYDKANLTLNALFRLIKARKPDAFVWLVVVKQYSHSDERWLRAMTFQPDGLQISNLRQFHSPFAETRRRYVEIVGTDVPMIVAGFYGQKTAVEEKKQDLSMANRIEDPQARETAKDATATQLGSVGVAVAQDFAQLETALESLG